VILYFPVPKSGKSRIKKRQREPKPLYKSQCYNQIHD
jgi:hypothetical protein